MVQAAEDGSCLDASYCLPGGKLPDRTDFTGLSTPQRIAQWSQAVLESERLADEWQTWLAQGCPVDQVQPL